MTDRRRALVTLGALGALAAVPLVAGVVNQPFYLDLFRRIMIFAIAAVSLDIILGYGGMVSLGHAAYLGIGAYAVAIPARAIRPSAFEDLHAPLEQRRSQPEGQPRRVDGGGPG